MIQALLIKLLNDANTKIIKMQKSVITHQVKTKMKQKTKNMKKKQQLHEKFFKKIS